MTVQPSGAGASDQTPTLEGWVLRKEEEKGAALQGWVRLEDVSEADGPAAVVAETTVSMPANELRAPFHLKLPPNLDLRAHYNLAAELSGEGFRYGTVQSFPWRPDKPREGIAVDVKRWH